MANAPGATSGTTINRVRLLGDGGDALAARLSVERILGHAANVSSLPPAAILCVKRVRDPLPGSIRLTTSAAVTARWTQSLHETLADMARRAVRPARGGAAADADAVLFDDRAQLLACLADDWCSGQIGARWWWRALCGASLDVRALLRMFLERPEHIAAAIEELARVGAAIRFVRHLPFGDTRMLLDAVVATHNLHEIAQAIAASIDLPDAPGNGSISAETSTMSTRAEYMALDNRRAAPWQHVAPEASKAELHPDQQLLIGVTLTVRRRPILARSAHFAAAIREWRIASDQTPRVASDQTPHRVMSAATAAVARQLVEHSSEPSVDAASVSAESAPVAMAVDPQPSEETPAVDARVEHAFLVAHHATQQLAITERDAVRTTEVHTDLGGLFYLLNVAIALGYYGDFTAPRHRSLDVSIWDFVAVVGRSLLRRRAEDPAWALLATLAGREPGDAVDGHTIRRIRPFVGAVRARLVAALGCRTRAALVRMVFEHRARILSTATHLDIVFSLADLPIEIRWSGLDRDPGWIPSADRIVMFHYE